MCPRCRSDFLMIKKVEGIERLAVYITAERKYRCRDCNHIFRAPDRRRKPRSEEEIPLRLAA